MEDFVKKTLLFDFYGELLTEHQKSIYEEIVFDDFSISEIAREHGISRQSVHDMRKRCEKILADYEERLHLVERFVNIRESVTKIQKLTEASESSMPAEERMLQIRSITDKVLEEL